MKNGICTIVGVVGSFIASLFGGWDTALVTLMIFMASSSLACSISPRRLMAARWRAGPGGRASAAKA